MGDRRVLLQTRVPQEVADWVRESSKEEAETVATWLRRLLLKEYRRENGFKGPSEG